MAPPTQETSDYITLGMHLTSFIIGAPVNLVALQQLSEQATGRLDRLLLLKQHLNFSDLLILFIYVPARICWTLTYAWRGGEFLCRLYKFFEALAFQVRERS